MCCSGVPGEVREDLVDARRVFDAGNEPDGAAARPAGLDIDVEHPLHQKQTLKYLCLNGRSGSGE